MPTDDEKSGSAAAVWITAADTYDEKRFTDLVYHSCIRQTLAAVMSAHMAETCGTPTAARA